MSDAPAPPSPARSSAPRARQLGDAWPFPVSVLASGETVRHAPQPQSPGPQEPPPAPSRRPAASRRRKAPTVGDLPEAPF